jgi:hypothetical protein
VPSGVTRNPPEVGALVASENVDVEVTVVAVAAAVADRLAGRLSRYKLSNTEILFWLFCMMLM